MSFLPILVGLLLFLNNGNKLSFLNYFDLPSIIEVAKQFGIGGDFLSNVPPEVIENLSSGNLDLKSILPIIIKFFLKKKEVASPPPTKNYDMNFMNGEIKTALYNYLKA